MASAASDTYLTCPVGATFKRDLTLTDVDVSTLASMSFEICAYPGATTPLLTAAPTAQSAQVARVLLADDDTADLAPGCYYYYFRIVTPGGESAVPEEGVFKFTP